MIKSLILKEHRHENNFISQGKHNNYKFKKLF